VRVSRIAILRDFISCLRLALFFQNVIVSNSQYSQACKNIFKGLMKLIAPTQGVDVSTDVLNEVERKLIKPVFIF